jgi:polyhydroxybutyrate depolymerase
MIKSFSSWSAGIAFALCLAGLAAPTARADSYFDSIVAGGRERHFMLALPYGAERGKPMPTVIALHGAAMNGRSMRRIFGMDELSERDRFAVVYPDGLKRRWNDGRTGEDDGPSDVGFMRRLADHLVREGIADPKRLFLLGVSNGGMMTYRVACEAPEIFAAYAAVIANLPVQVAEGCRGRGAAPMLIINSTDDKIIPWEGGEIGGFFRRGEVLSTPDTVAFWQRQNGCSAEAQTKPLPDKDATDGSTVLAKQYADCKSGAPVVLLTVQGGGHLPPGAQIGNRPMLRLMLGPVNQDISAADVSWKFFKRFPMQR